MPLSSFFRGASAIAGHSRSSSQPLNSSGASFDPPPNPSATTNGAPTATSSATGSTTGDSESGVAGGHVRSYSHTISNPTSFSSASLGGAVMPSFLSPTGSPLPPPPPSHPTMDIYAAAEADEEDVPLGLDPALVRRSHTLSTGSGSRLSRLEKRQALSNMAEEDRRFFGDDSAGPSPVDPIPTAAGRLPQIGEGSPRMAQSGFQVVRAYKDSDADGAVEAGSTGGGPALYSQATVQRNVSHPTRLQSPSPSGQSRTWGPSTGRGMVGANIVKSDSLRRRMAGMTEGAADRSGNWRVKEETTEDQEEPQSSSLPSDNGFLAPGATLHRAASERTPGAGHHRSFSDLDPSIDAVRRHTSLRAGGRWGASPALPSEIFPGGSSGGSSGSRSPTVDGGTEALMRRGSVGRRPAAALAASGVPARDNSPRSPMAVPGFGSGPWSPTAEEAIKLREPTAAMLRRSGSGDNLSNPGSRVSPPRRARASDEAIAVEDDGPDLEKLQSAFARMEAAHPTEQNVDAVGLPPRVSGAGTPSSAKPRVPLPPLVTNFTTPPRTSSKPLSFFGTGGGPQSAAPYVPPIGHSARQPNGADPEAFRSEALARLGQTAVPGVGSSLWRSQKEAFAGTVVGQQVSPGGPLDWSAGPGVAPTPMSGLEQQIHQQILINQQLQQLQQLQQQQQILQQQQAQLLGQSQPFSPHLQQQQLPNGAGEQFGLGPPFQRSFGAPPPSTGFYAPPANGQPIFSHPAPPPPAPPASQQSARPPPSQQQLNALAQLKGYNPPHFDVRPATARFFVIKSYTEADVHKSLKYEIWASTDLGNKRLDKAFKESAEAGPIYLFFSVNASGHFCGMAQMLTAVDYNTNSTVWAQDKWKGVFSVRWVFVKDVPNAALRHIRLNNTPENKPVTSSRDTQEVPYQEGLSIMQILSSYQSRTTLLQDFDWYDQNEHRRGSGDQAIPATPSPNPPQGAALEPPPQRHQSPHKAVSPNRFGLPQHLGPPNPTPSPSQYPTAQGPIVPIRRFQQQQV